MRYGLKKSNKISAIIAGCLLISLNIQAQDSIPSGFSKMPEWRIGAEIHGGWVPGTTGYLKGDNPEHKRISSKLGGDIRAGFSFAPSTPEWVLYPGLYQGIGVGMRSFLCNDMLGTPISVYAYQGAPIVHINRHLWLGYEWQFGVACGWKHFDENDYYYNLAIGTPVTAYLGLGIKLHYQLSERWQISAGVEADHYSNGNTAWPNAGINSIGANVGITYIINPLNENHVEDSDIISEADRRKWFYDIMAYGAWRKRTVFVGELKEPELCPGKFGVLGLQFAPAYSLNRWVSIGPALDMQWDESAGLSPYWVDGSWEENIKFQRPPFGKQLSVGLSAHAELTMPIFSVNAGLGVNILNPYGDKRFYQSLTLKTFVTKNIYINVGYRLGRFKDPQNLMLGIGVRL